MSVQMMPVKAGRMSGIGLHTGEKAEVLVRPSPGNGIRFFKGGKAVPMRPSPSARCTAIGEGADRILTVEHLLSAAAGLGVTDFDVDVDGPEMPGLDGSALEFVKFFKSLGLASAKKQATAFRVREPIFCSEERKAISVVPADRFSVCYTLDYGHPGVKTQTVDFEVTPEIFESKIAPARTFCTEEEARAARAAGLGKGATTQNTLVISASGPADNAYRLENECAAHKVLDLIGDLALLGFPLAGRVIAVRSGHSLNQKLVEAILKQKEGI
jgi:UDP-3-O-acyl N-acetylglucosamine deacetylase